VDPVAIATGIAAILTATGGVILVIRELRRRERREYDKEIGELSDQLHLCRSDFTAFRLWAFQLRQSAADRGVDAGEPPQPRHLVDEVPSHRRGVVRDVRWLDDGNGGAGDGGPENDNDPDDNSRRGRGSSGSSG
jgi:hypothetical protein